MCLPKFFFIRVLWDAVESQQRLSVSSLERSAPAETWIGEGPNLLTALSFFVFILWFIHQYTNLCNGQIYFKHVIQPGSQALPVTDINLQKCLLYFIIVLVNFCS